MSIERAIICDGCGAVMSAGRTVKAAWVDARQACDARRIRGKHYHASCLPQHKVGEYIADYSVVTAVELAQPTGAEELLERSKRVHQQNIAVAKETK